MRREFEYIVEDIKSDITAPFEEVKDVKRFEASFLFVMAGVIFHNLFDPVGRILEWLAQSFLNLLAGLLGL